MKQTIGKVTLDDTFYPGQDLYSDGPVEEELLAIAEKHPEEELNAVIAEKKSWPVLYHFSHIRQNILEWMPFTREDRVLEIGSGCGAITGAIARKAGHVTCIDLSMMRSRINANRNRQYDNIEILVGNFRDIEQNLTEKFDYITLIGVFEYADGYMGTQEPYLDMLKCIEKHLAPGGKLVIAIENRLGLKYWSGATEDHFGQHFVGLEGYQTTKGVKTFSRKELLDLLQRAGDFRTECYYPYPDYKLPMTIYSENKLPEKDEISGFAPNFDRPRIALFNEPRVWNSILDAGLFPEFSNSFLVIAERTDRPEASRRLLYSKYSNERRREFAIRTDIWQEGSQRVVEKTALYPEGEAHIRQLAQWQQELEKSYESIGFAANRCEMKGASARLEYLTAETLEEQLDRWMECGKTEEAKAAFVDYLKKIQQISEEQDFTRTPEFEEVFGIPELPEGLKSARVTNLDLVCQNLVLTNPSTVLDYEWTFAFPIPGKFVLYRVIHYFTANRGESFPLSAEELYQSFGITGELQTAFVEMEQSFQSWIVGSHTPIRELHSEISPGVQEFSIAPIREVQVFFSCGDGYSETRSVRKQIHRQHVSWTLQLPEGCTDVRVDPGDVPSMTYIRELSFDGQPADLTRAGVSQGFLNGNWLCCPKEDPNLSGIPVPKGAREMTLKLAIFENDPRVLEKTAQLEAENRRLRGEAGGRKASLLTRAKAKYQKIRERKQ